MQNLILEENISDNYKVRTEENVNNSDLTLAIAIDFDSFGEKITKELTIKADKKYIAVSPDGDPIEKAAKIVAKMNELNLPQKFILNIAGNGLVTMRSPPSAAAAALAGVPSTATTRTPEARMGNNDRMKPGIFMPE